MWWGKLPIRGASQGLSKGVRIWRWGGYGSCVWGWSGHGVNALLSQPSWGTCRGTCSLPTICVCTCGGTWPLSTICLSTGKGACTLSTTCVGGGRGTVPWPPFFCMADVVLNRGRLFFYGGRGSEPWPPFFLSTFEKDFI